MDNVDPISEVSRKTIQVLSNSERVKIRLADGSVGHALARSCEVTELANPKAGRTWGLIVDRCDDYFIRNCLWFVPWEQVGAIFTDGEWVEVSHSRSAN